MGNRLSKIYTVTGAKGVTGVGGALVLPENIDHCLLRIQHELFDLGGELCMPGTALIPDRYVDQLEHDLDALNANLPPLQDFILPGGSEAAARCHLARTIARRAERRVVSLAREQAV